MGDIFDKVDPTPKDIFDKASDVATPKASPSAGPEFNPDMYPMDKMPAEQVVRPIMEAGGLMGGAAAGLASPVPGGSVIGAGLGYGMGKGASDWMYGTNKDQTLVGSLVSGAKYVGVGAATEMTGLVGGKVLGAAFSLIGKVGKAAFGKFTGAGTGAAEEAVKGSKAFTDAMRGKISGEEIVQNAKDALGIIKSNRSVAYRQKLSDISNMKGEIDTTPLYEKTTKLLENYGVRAKVVDGKPILDYERSAIGRRGVRDIKGVMKIIGDFGKQEGDKTPIGLDTLKRQLDDFYSESSNARGFVTELRGEVKRLLVKEVPEYANMTKGYSEATTIIKDIESGLMLRKQGMSGRVVADQTLRRLMSSMRDNFQLRKELLETLGNQGGQDLSGQVAGYTMGSYLPHGITGAGMSIAGTAASLKYLNPKFVPILLASSPRVAGEFLRMLGKASVPMAGTSSAAAKAAAYMTVPPAANLLSE